MSNENEKTCTKCTVDVQTDNDYYVIRNWPKKPTLDHLYDCEKMQKIRDYLNAITTRPDM